MVGAPLHSTIKISDVSSEVYFPDRNPNKEYNEWRVANEEKSLSDDLPFGGGMPNDADLLP